MKAKGNTKLLYLLTFLLWNTSYVSTLSLHIASYREQSFATKHLFLVYNTNHISTLLYIMQAIGNTEPLRSTLNMEILKSPQVRLT